MNTRQKTDWLVAAYARPKTTTVVNTPPTKEKDNSHADKAFWESHTYHG